MTAKDFLKKHRNDADCIDASEVIEAFLSEMRDGQSGKRSSLAMLPTYLSGSGDFTCGKRYIVIDAGGTNFRSAVGYYDGNEPVIEDERVEKMPATDKCLSADEFYDAIALGVKRLLGSARDIGFCFSYPVKMTADGDGVILSMPKGVDAPEIIGTKVGERTLSAISRLLGADEPRRIVILNDTVAALLGSRTEGDCARIGYIYGTGTNLCCTVGGTIVNTECGNFDKFPLGDFESSVVGGTSTPDEYVLEKATAGKYLASVIREAYSAAEREGVLKAKTAVDFTLAELSDFLSGKPTALCKAFSDDADRTAAVDIANGMIERAAKLGAIANSAAAVFCGNSRVEITAEGTTFYKLNGYRQHFEKYLNAFLGARGIAYRLTRGKGNLCGALAAVFAETRAQSV